VRFLRAQVGARVLSEAVLALRGVVLIPVLASVLADMRPLHTRAGIALLVPVLSVLVLPARSRSLSFLYVALGLAAVATIWFAFGGARLFRNAIAPATRDRYSEASL